MNSPKVVVTNSTEGKLQQKTSVDPTHLLEGAKTSGNKMMLLESLLVEGKLSRSPYVGAQAMQAEVTLNAHEIISQSITASPSMEMSVAQELTPGQRIDLVKRVLETRPTLTSGELRAACEMLSIDSGPLLESLIERKAQRLHETVEQEKNSRNRQNIIRTLTYEPEEDLVLIRKQYEKAFGLTIHTHLEDYFTSTREKLELDVAMFGSAQTPYEELQRVRALIEFERAHRERMRYLFPKPKLQDLDDAEEKLKDAEELLEDEATFEDENEDEIYLLLESARKALHNYKENLTPIDRDPYGFYSLVLALIAGIICLVLGFSVSPLLTAIAITGTCSFFLGRWLLSGESIRRNILRELSEKRLSQSQKNALARSASIKRQTT